jgi:hypothetical protein
VRAVNLAEHARNPIHTDAGARAAGFDRALVAGVTTYAYLTHVPAAAWGEPWIRSGGGEVRFRAPVFVDDEICCTPRSVDGGSPAGADDAVTVDALVDDDARATFVAVRSSGPAPAMRDGERLATRRVELVGEFGQDYGSRAGDDLDLYRACGIVHPAVWPALANLVVHSDVARGSWVHTRSIVRHHATADAGSTAVVTGVVVERFSTRAGERAVLDVQIEVAGTVVATLEHEAIVALPGR